MSFQGHSGLFWPESHYLVKLGRGLVGDATYQISRLLEKNFSFRVSLYKPL